MNKNFYFFVTVIVALLIVISAGFILFNSNFSEYDYSIIRNNVEFVSNSFEPKELISEMSESEVFIVSPRFVEKGSENTFMLPAVTTFSSVLVFKEKSVVMIARILDENGDLNNCQSNLGDTKTSEFLSKSECELFFNDSSAVKIFIDFPNEKLKHSRVILEKNKITVTPVSFDAVPSVSFEVLNAFYEDTEKIIQQINAVVSGL